jgi:hypothetical protein
MKGINTNIIVFLSFFFNLKNIQSVVLVLSVLKFYYWLVLLALYSQKDPQFYESFYEKEFLSLFLFFSWRIIN